MSKRPIAVVVSNDEPDSSYGAERLAAAFGSSLRPGSSTRVVASGILMSGWTGLARTRSCCQEAIARSCPSCRGCSRRRPY